jgi:hypothetical protein
MTPDIADITTRLRQTRANMLGGDDEDHYWDCHEAAAEIERLRRWARLTDAEREAIAAGIGALEALYVDQPAISRPLYDAYAPTLRGLLDRTDAGGK